MNRIFFFFLLISFSVSAQEKDSVFHVLAHQTTFSKKGDHTRNILLMLSFRCGEKLKTDTLFNVSSDSAKGFDRVRVHKNRYAWDNSATVFDLKTRKFIHYNTDVYVANLRGDSLQYVIEYGKRKGVYVFHFESGKFSAYTDSIHQRLAGGILSPDSKHSLRISKSARPYSIMLHDGKSEKKIIADAGSGNPLLEIASTKPTVPVYWIDNDHFVFVNYSRSDSSFVFVQSDLEGKTEIISQKFAARKGIVVPRFFYEDADSSVRFFSSGLIFSKTASGNYFSPVTQFSNSSFIKHVKETKTDSLIFSDGSRIGYPSAWNPELLTPQIVLMSNESAYGSSEQTIHWWLNCEQKWMEKKFPYRFVILDAVRN